MMVGTITRLKRNLYDSFSTTRVVINRHLDKGMLVFHKKDDPPWLEADSWETVRNFLDRDFMRQCGIEVWW